MIHHHLPEAMLLAYASGAATEAESVLVTSHLTLCPACRSTVADLEALGGALLEAPAESADPGGIEAMLAGALDLLDAPPTAPEPEPEPEVAHDPRGIFPAPLVTHGRVLQRSWRRVFPGVQRMVLDDLDHRGMPLRLFRLKPDMRVPDHAHEGRELSLVLTGGFTDDHGHYVRGDIADRGEDGVHRQHIDPGEPCIVVVLADAPLLPRTLRGELARLLFVL